MAGRCVLDPAPARLPAGALPAWRYYSEEQNIRCTGVIRDRRSEDRGTPDRRRRDRECRQVILRVGPGRAYRARLVAQAGTELPSGVGSTHYCQRCRAVTELEPVSAAGAGAVGSERRAS